MAKNDGNTSGINFIDPQDPKSSNESPAKAVIYGAPGSGKTGLAMTAPDPLLIDFESGGLRTARAVLSDLKTQGYEVSKNARIVSINAEASGGIQAREQLDKVLDYLRSKSHPFKTVIIDPIGEMQKMLMKEVLERYPLKRAMGNQPAMQDWGKSLSEANNIIQSFRALDLHVIIVAHAEMPDNENDDIHPLATGKSFKPFLEGAMDLLGYLKIQTVEDTQGNKSTERILITNSDGRIRAKNRGGKLPSVISSPNMSDIFDLMDS